MLEKKKDGGLRARGGAAVIMFFAIIAVQGYLLRNVLFKNALGTIPAPIWAELAFCAVMLAGIVICCVRPQGWGTGIGRYAALGIFVVYAAFNILFYNEFVQSYLTGFNPQFDSAAGGLVGGKLVAALIGVVAGIPVMPKIDDREYARRMREKVMKQNAERARASVKGAHDELNANLERLKGSLTKEEMEELIRELQKSVDESAEILRSENTPSEEEEAEAAAKRFDKIAEDWRGWGAGM